jgi:transposase
MIADEEVIDMKIRSIGIDLGKTIFNLVALGERGKTVIKKKLSRIQLLTFTANLQPSLIGLQACSGSHFLGRALSQQGHESNKNDYLDAEAIAEAVDRKNMRFVPIKTDDQLDLQALHRVRDRLVSRRTAVINQVRAFLWNAASPSAKGRRACDGRCPAMAGQSLRRAPPRHAPSGCEFGLEHPTR